nr:LysR family transcriptional regulator [Bradyrhizobium retamae]
MSPAASLGDPLRLPAWNFTFAIENQRRFTRAAEKRNTSQAAFSRWIKSLQAWLGFDLIDRSVYPTQLTPQGERFRACRRVAAADARQPRRACGIRIALPFAMATARLPHWWQAWSQERRLSCSVVVATSTISSPRSSRTTWT